MTTENKDANRNWLVRPLFSKKAEYWVTMTMIVAVVVFSIVLAKSSSAKSNRHMEVTQRNHSELMEIRKEHQEIHAAESKRRIDILFEIRTRMQNLESEVRRLRRDLPSNELASKMESMSNQDWQAMVLENVNPKDRKILESHFKQENEFKASLSRTQKKQFDDEVRKTYVKMLADSGGKDALSSLQKQAMRRTAETTTIKEWRSRETTNHALANAADYVAQRDERLRLFRETLDGETESKSK